MSHNLPTTRRIGDLIDDATEGRLVVKPIFQRRLVWNNADKERFIDTILRGYPFPEVFIAEGKRDHKSTRREKVLVDGQQRLSAIIAYGQNSSEYFLYKTILRFSDLQSDQRTTFLDYVVAVRDLGTATEEVIRDIFNRINSTDYALKSMEMLNAMFSGPYKQFCEQLSRDNFFEQHRVFSKGYQKRMMDVNFCVIFVTTLMSGYYNRDERNKEYLDKYNEEFSKADEVRVGIDRVFDFVNQCSLREGSRAFRQTDLFTLLVELHQALVIEKLELSSSVVGSCLQPFYDQIDARYKGKTLPDQSSIEKDDPIGFNYWKAAAKATNDKYSRVHRAQVIAQLLRRNLPSEDKPKKSKSNRGKK